MMTPPCPEADGHTMSDANSSRRFTFDLTTPLGMGAQGIVFRAHDNKLGRDVAIKFIHIDRSERAALEHARALARTNHPNIVTVFDVVDEIDPTDGAQAHAVVMEIVEGETLSQLAERALAGETARRIGTGVIDAISAYHELGLAHCDLHEEQVMVGTRVVKLIDTIYKPTAFFQSTANRTAQQGKDIRDLRSLLLLVLRASLSRDHAFVFDVDLSRVPTLDELRRAFYAVFSQPPAARAPSVRPPQGPSDEDRWRQSVALAIKSQARFNVSIVGGVSDSRTQRPAVIESISIGLALHSHFQLRIAVREHQGLGIARAGVPVIDVPYSNVINAWQDGDREFHVELRNNIEWNGTRLVWTRA